MYPAPPRSLELRFVPPDKSQLKSPRTRAIFTQSSTFLSTSARKDLDITLTREEKEALESLSLLVPVGIVEKGMVNVVEDAGEEWSGGVRQETETARSKDNRLLVKSPETPRKREAMMTLDDEDGYGRPPLLTGGVTTDAHASASYFPEEEDDIVVTTGGGGQEEGAHLHEEVVANNLAIGDSARSPLAGRPVESWPSRLLKLLANNLLDSSIKATHSGRRRSQMWRAMEKVRFVTDVKNQVAKKKMSHGTVQRMKVKNKKEVRAASLASGTIWFLYDGLIPPPPPHPTPPPTHRSLTI